MTTINEVLTQVIALAQATTPYANIVIGAMPPDDGISITIGAGAPEAIDWTKAEAYSMTLVVNGKNASQATVSEALNTIHHALTKAMSYPRGENWQITNIRTVATPSYIGREENKQFLYGSSVEVRFYYSND